MQAFPKIFQLGHRHTLNIWDGPVEITEKVDGSQFGFGKINNQIVCRSRGKQIILDAPDALFDKAVDYVVNIFAHKSVPDNFIFWGEYLKKPKHNVLAYNRVPKNHIALFGGMDLESGLLFKWNKLEEWADFLDVDIVPLLDQTDNGNENVVQSLQQLLEHESFLGGPKIEGVVIKNYYHELWVGEVLFPLQAAKYVSEKYKEKHDHKAKADKHGGVQGFIDSFRTEARWLKAIQHLRENGALLGEPKDIGPLIWEIQTDLIEEHEDEIKEHLYKTFLPQFKRKAIAGFPEYYKEYLVKQMEVNKNEERQETETEA